MRVRRRRATRTRPRRLDPRLILLGLAAALAVFLFATSRHSKSVDPGELPVQAAQRVVLGRPLPSLVRVRQGDFLQVALPYGPDDRFGTVISGAPEDRPVLEVTSGTDTPPQLRALNTGSVVLTVLLEPHCPDEGVCREYRQDLGAARVTVTP